MTDTTETTDPAIIIPKESALAVLTDQEKFDAFYERVKQTVTGVEIDLTTSAGRKAVASLAFKVTKSKTAIVDAANDLTEEWRSNTAKVVASRKAIEEKLAALAKEVRKPLTDWEEAEELRETRANTLIDALRRSAIVPIEATATEVEWSLGWLDDADVIVNDLNRETLGDHYDIALNLREVAREALTAALARIKKAESDAAELATLRAQQEARDAEDQERRDREAQEKADREAEEHRAADEKAERERQTARDEEIAAAARAETQRKADEASAAALEEERKKTAAAEAETKRLADEKAAREEQEAADRAAEEKRQRDRKHRGEVMGAAKVAMIEAMGKTLMPEFATPEVRESIAVSIVRAIVAGEIPAVTLAF